MLSIERPIDPLTPDPIIWFGDTYHISNTTLLAFCITLGLGILGVLLSRALTLKPGLFQVAIEYVYEQLYTLTKGIIGNEKSTRFFFPVIGGLFVFIIISNLVGIIPGVTSILYDGKPVFRPPTSDFNTTFGLALGSLVMIHVLMLSRQGIRGYIGNYVKIVDVIKAIPKGIGAVSMAVIHFFIGLLDIVGEAAKVISLSLRLFGNIYAGQVLATVIASFIAFVIPVTWSVYSSIAGIIQSIVFAALVASYYALALASNSTNDQNTENEVDNYQNG